MDLKLMREQFPIFKNPVNDRPLIYLDSAATTLKPQRVIDRLTKHYTHETANIHRGVYFLSEQATLAFEGVREKVRGLLNAPSASEIVFTRGTTEAINLVANCLGGTTIGPGDEILISEMEHHANIVPWQLLRERTGCVIRVLPIDDNGDLILSKLDELTGPKTKLISVVHVSNSLGTVNPVKLIGEYAKKKKILFLVDGAQSVATMPVDVRDIGCDFFVFSGHKLFGPTGAGALWARSELLEKMPPWQGGGDMIASVTFERTTFNSVPFKFEAGTPAIAEVIAMGEAIDFVQSVGLEKVEAYEADLLAYATERLSAIDGLRIVGTARKKVAIVSFVLEDIHPHDIGTLLDQHGVCVRTGHHCCQPVMKRFGVPATARASFSIYNQRSDVDRLAEAIEKVKKVFA